MSLISNDFNYNININKSALYHFLDGYLDPNIGNTKENSINYLKNILKGNEENINLLDIELINFITMDCELKFHSSKSDSVIKYNNFKLNNITESLSNLTSNESIVVSAGSGPDTLDTRKLKLLEHFKYCIVPVYHDKHATSILFFRHLNKQYMMTINSGKGIELHDNIININDDSDLRYYVPFKGYLIHDNILIDIDRCLSTIFKIISFGELY
jgi:hypothetical protein